MLIVFGLINGNLVAVDRDDILAKINDGFAFFVVYRLAVAALITLAANVGTSLVHDSILAALASTVMGAVIVAGVSVLVLVAVVAAKVADFVITVSTSFVLDSILAALASAVMGAVVVGSVLVFVLMGYGSLFERNLYHNALSRHGEGVLAVNESYNVYIIAFVRSHDERLPGNGIYFVAFFGGNADGNSFACRSDAGHNAVATTGGVA